MFKVLITTTFLSMEGVSVHTVTIDFDRMPGAVAACDRVNLNNKSGALPMGVQQSAICLW